MFSHTMHIRFEDMVAMGSDLGCPSSLLLLVWRYHLLTMCYSYCPCPVAGEFGLTVYGSITNNTQPSQLLCITSANASNQYSPLESSLQKVEKTCRQASFAISVDNAGSLTRSLAFLFPFGLRVCPLTFFPSWQLVTVDDAEKYNTEATRQLLLYWITDSCETEHA